MIGSIIAPLHLGFRGMGQRIWTSLVSLVVIKAFASLKRFYYQTPLTDSEEAMHDAVRFAIGPLLDKLTGWIDRMRERIPVIPLVPHPIDFPTHTRDRQEDDQ